MVFLNPSYSLDTVLLVANPGISDKLKARNPGRTSGGSRGSGGCPKSCPHSDLRGAAIGEGHAELPHGRVLRAAKMPQLVQKWTATAKDHSHNDVHDKTYLR